MSHLRAVPTPDEQLRTRSGSATSVRVEAPGRVPLFLARGSAGPDGEAPVTTVYQAVRLVATVTARRQARDAHGAITLTVDGPDEDPLAPQGLVGRAAHALAQDVGVTEGVDLLLRRRAPLGCGLGSGAAEAAAALVACNQLWGAGLSQADLCRIADALGADAAFPLLGACAVGHGDGLSPLMIRGSYQWVLALPHEGVDPAEVHARHDTRAEARRAAPAAPEENVVRPISWAAGARRSSALDVPEALTAALRVGDAAALAPLLHNDLQESVLSLTPALADVITLAEQAGAMRALVAGTGPAVAALVADTADAARVTRALSASGLVARVVRADAPVAGARVVG